MEDRYGCTVREEVSVSDDGSRAPISDFSWTQDELTVAITDQTQHMPTQWLWEWGDGTTSMNANPTYTYNLPGTYTVTLTTTNACGAHSTNQAVTVDVECNLMLTTSSTAASCGLPNGSATVIPTGGEAPYNISWGNDQTGPTATNLSPGIYEVSVEDRYGCTVREEVSVSDDGSRAPIPVFTWTPDELTVSFTDNTQHSPIQWKWEWGDGNTSAAANPTHTYDLPGTYTVTLTSTNACGSESTSQDITVEVECNLLLSTSSTAASCGLSNGSATVIPIGGEAPYNISWGNEQSGLTARELAPGLYEVSVEDRYGCRVQAEVGVSDDGSRPPIADFSLEKEELRVNFSANAQHSPVQWRWNFGDDQTSELRNPTHTYATPGTYTVTLTSTNACGSHLYQQEVTVEYNCNLALSFTPEAATCGLSNGAATVFPEGGASPYTIQWSDNQLGATAYNLFPGIYAVSVTDNNGCEINGTATVADAGGTFPTVGFEEEMTELEVSFTNLSVDANSYLWDFGDGTTSTLASPTYTYASPGEYTVCLIAMNECGPDTYCKTVTPFSCNLFLSASAVSATCGQANGSARVESMNAFGEVNYFWQNDSSLIGDVLENLAPGNYTVQATDSRGCIAKTLVTVENEGDVPQAGFEYEMADLTVNFQDRSQEADHYLWNFGNGFISDLANPIVTYASYGEYEVSQVVENACGWDTLVQLVELTNPTTSIAQPVLAKEIVLSPNPNSGQFWVEIAEPSVGQLTLEVVDMLGRRYAIREVRVNSGRNRFEWQMPGLAKGLYILQVKGERKQVSLRFEVMR